MRLPVCKVGLVAAIVMAGWHLCWSALVATGWAQSVTDFIFWMHFIKPVYTIEPFDVVRAAILLAVTASIGMIVGTAFAWVWNAAHRS